MNDYKLAQSEERFAELVWKNEPIVSGELVKICEKRTLLEEVNDLYGSEKPL
jgi:hypothetical protein